MRSIITMIMMFITIVMTAVGSEQRLGLWVALGLLVSVSVRLWLEVRPDGDESSRDASLGHFFGFRA